MLKISGPVGAALFVTATLASASIGLSIDSARADNCLATPKAAAPQGQHWYYHVDRATRRKCWYLHAAAEVRHRAAARHHAAATADANDEPAAEPATATPAAAAATPPTPAAVTPAPTAESAGTDTPPAPHVTVLTVKTVTPFVGTTALTQQSASEKAPAPSAQQSPLDGNAPAIANSRAAGNADEAAPEGKADAAFVASAQAAEAASAAARTKTAEAFILLAAVLGVAAALTAIVSRLVGMYRRPRISFDPDAAWVDDRSGRRRIDVDAGHDEADVPFLDPQEHYGLADLHAQRWLDGSAPAQDQSSMSMPPSPNADAVQTQSQRPILADIEAALRVLRQARQSRVA